jgi:hypothetical protein
MRIPAQGLLQLPVISFGGPAQVPGVGMDQPLQLQILMELDPLNNLAKGLRRLVSNRMWRCPFVEDEAGDQRPSGGA